MPKPFDLKQGKLDQTRVHLSWTKPDFPGYNVTWYRVEVADLGYDQFVDTTSTTISSLKPSTTVVVSVSGCTEARVVKCGNPRGIITRTDFGGKGQDQANALFVLRISLDGIPDTHESL